MEARRIAYIAHGTNVQTVRETWTWLLVPVLGTLDDTESDPRELTADSVQKISFKIMGTVYGIWEPAIVAAGVSLEEVDGIDKMTGLARRTK